MENGQASSQSGSSEVSLEADWRWWARCLQANNGDGETGSHWKSTVEAELMGISHWLRGEDGWESGVQKNSQHSKMNGDGVYYRQTLETGACQGNAERGGGGEESVQRETSHRLCFVNPKKIAFRWRCTYESCRLFKVMGGKKKHV